MIEETDIRPIGKFLKTHALKGELNAQLDIDAEFMTPDTPIIVNLDGIYVPFFPSGVRPKGHFASLVSLDGIDSEEKARQFVNLTIYARNEDIDNFLGDEEDEDAEGSYADDLIGFDIVAQPGNLRIGEISDVDFSTVNVLFIIETDEGPVYIPASPDFIDRIDTENRIVFMTLPDGLIDLNLKKQNND